MQGLHDTAQVILQILRDPALTGICSLLGIPLAVLLARQAKANQHPSSPHVKKISLTTRNLFTRGSIDKRSKINKPQEPYASEQKRSAPPDGILIVKEPVSAERANFNRAVFQYLKKNDPLSTEGSIC